MTDLQHFIDFQIPLKTNRNRIAAQIENSSTSITTDEALIAWYEHDALHFLGNHPFTENGEECVAFLEKVFNRGWLPYGEKYNMFKPKECEYSHITQELIAETAELIKKLCE